MLAWVFTSTLLPFQHNFDIFGGFVKNSRRYGTPGSQGLAIIINPTKIVHKWFYFTNDVGVADVMLLFSCDIYSGVKHFHRVTCPCYWHFFGPFVDFPDSMADEISLFNHKMRDLRAGIKMADSGYIESDKRWSSSEVGQSVLYLDPRGTVCYPQSHMHIYLCCNYGSWSKGVNSFSQKWWRGLGSWVTEHGGGGGGACLSTTRYFLHLG